MKPLEVRRWQRALRVLEHGIENEANSIRVSVPSLEGWLHSFGLAKFHPDFVNLGAVELQDIILMKEDELQRFGFSELDLRKWECGLKALCPEGVDCLKQLAQRPTDRVDLFTLREWLDCHHLGRIYSALVELGAVSPTDLLDLSTSEVDCLSLRRLEQIRWVQAMKELHTTEPLFPPFLLTLPYDQNVSSSSSLTNIEDNTSWLANQNFRDPLDDNLVNNLKHVVAKTKSFQQDMENWDGDLVEFLLNEISAFINAQVEAANKKYAIRFLAEVLDSLKDIDLLESLLAKLIGNGELVHSTSSRALFMRIASALRLLHEQAEGKPKRGEGRGEEEDNSDFSINDLVDKSLVIQIDQHEEGRGMTSKSSVDCDPQKSDNSFSAKKKKQQASQIVHQPPMSKEAWSPTQEDRKVSRSMLGRVHEIDERVLAKLKYRWMATSFTLQGESARKEWIAKFKPPDLFTDDEWLTLEGTNELIRIVLQFMPFEISDMDVEMFFRAIDIDDSGYISFYKLVGLLEADNTQLRHGRNHHGRKRVKKKKKSKTTKKSSSLGGADGGVVINPPWKPASKQNQVATLISALPYV
eukprot:CAMPEP_0114342950 /NCGR_PEP_ID=MMETSP0101-20121206/10206_1 /TAXON_ID=38822 ORGANISM="Pteridomonas danica, Strain PT" /NCGR_SAMPLE_ID=MMETSP0101 /ASSEMBLY_ACC=CAM_ASM_000211 /LENGTH=581 /DNA_ID=CAMNT_0001477359 /DNA_START=511 /DNA_END=2254 /DNA_ORIENTATION=-